MDQKQIDILTQKIADKTISDAELKQYYDWLANDDQLPLQISGAANREELQSRIFSNIAEKSGFTSIKSKTVKLWPRIVAAAAVAVIVFGAGLFYYSAQNKKDQSLIVVNDIAPGASGATLTLANGQKILIKDALAGNIATQSGVKISKTADGQIVYEVSDNHSTQLEYNTLSTTRGEQTRVRLPDGSLVFLNAASSLKYPTSFANLKDRSVELSGEGYFEIAKDKLHSFIVKTNRQQVEVLGTHFNINAYNDEPTVKTTLLEGSVRLTANSMNEVLKPNQQAVLNNDKISIREVDTEEIVAWKNNEFLFKDDDFKTNMRKIARWYDVEIVYEANAPDNFKLGGFSSRSRNLSAILKLMEKTDKVHFKIIGKKVYVSK